MTPQIHPAAGRFGAGTPRRRIVTVVVGTALAGIAAVFIATRPAATAHAQPEAARASLTVNVVAATSVAFERSVAATGTVTARDELLIGSDATGVRLTEVLAEVGSVVRRGDLLARGDDALLRAQLAQQQAALRQAQADHAQAEANLDRAERLADSGVYSVETIQVRRTAAASAAAKVDLAQAQVRELEVRLAQTRVFAPADGVISRKVATVGTVVQPGTELFRMIRGGELEWLAELPNHGLAKVAAGARASVVLEDGRTVEGRVRLVAPTMDVNTRNGLVYVTLPRGTAVKAGQHARGEIRVEAARSLALPESSIQMRDGYAFVYVVGADSVVRVAKIRTGERRGGLVEVSAGLDASARIVGTGAGFVKEGDLVRVAPQSSSHAALMGERS